MPLIVLLLLLLPGVVSAQVLKAPYRTANVGLCIAPLNPPSDSVHILCNSPTWGKGPWSDWTLPGFFPNGGIRTGIWLGCPADSVVSFEVVRAGVVVQRSFVVETAQPEDLTKKCWEAKAPTGPQVPLKMSDIKSPTDRLNDLGRDCLSDPVCAQLVIGTCRANDSCRGALSDKLTTVDFDNDGRAGTTWDAFWWDMTLRGEIR